MNVGPALSSQIGVGSSARPSDDPAKIRKAATEFEALLFTQMMKSARGDASTGTGGDADASGSSLIELSEQQFAQALASSGGLGIAKMVIAGLNSNANR